MRPTVNCQAFFFLFFCCLVNRKISRIKSYCWKLSSKLTTAMLLIKFIVVIVSVASVVLVDSLQFKSNVHIAKYNKKSTALFVSTFDSKQSSKLGEHFHFLAGAFNYPGFYNFMLKKNHPTSNNFSSCKIFSKQPHMLLNQQLETF